MWEYLTPDFRNILQPALVGSCNRIPSSFHSKLGLMKQFVKLQNNEGFCLKYIRELPNLNDDAVNEGVLLDAR